VGYPDFKPAANCVSCGLCLTHCPTYRELPTEMASPRGRIQLIKGLVDGSLRSGAALEEHLSLCLACRACETACPSGVRYGTLIESARDVMADHEAGPGCEAGAGEKLAGFAGRLLDTLFMRYVFPNPAALTAVALAMKAYQVSGLQWLVRSTPAGRLLPARLAELEAMMPSTSSLAEMRGLDEEYPPIGPERGRVGFLSGCVMQLCLGPTNAASIEVLTRNGFRVLVPRSQCCCGALHLHRGWLDGARQMARRNLEAFESARVDAVVTNAAGCGSAFKDYAKLLEDDPIWRDRAAHFSASARDLQEFLVERGFTPPAGRLNARVSYSDPCHLLHAQGVKSQPRALLRSIPGVELVEPREADWCCGSAGIYNLTHTRMSMAILRRKMEDVLSQEPDLIATANPGCLFQLRYGVQLAGSSVPVVHVMDLLARSYRLEAVTAGRGTASGPRAAGWHPLARE
jgi:glycolate oxidase iron-sulfur subunit